MQDLAIILKGGLSVLPMMAFPAVLLIVVQYFNFGKLKKRFSDCVMRKGIVQEIGVREATKAQAYRRCFVACSFADDNTSLEVLYEGGDLKDTKVGDEIPVYFYPNGTATVVAYDDETTKKKFRQQVIVIIILCVVMAFIIPVVGLTTMNNTPK